MKGPKARTTLAEDYDYVIGGDPDRDTIDLAVLDTATGGIRAHIEATADGPGYTRMLDWARQHAPGRRVWALEGTGRFAAGIAGELALAGEDVVEVGALKRARGAKNDRLDAVRAARTALAREHQSSPRVRGLREAIRPCQRPARRCFSAAPRPSMNSKASLWSHRNSFGRSGAAVCWPPSWY